MEERPSEESEGRCKDEIVSKEKGEAREKDARRDSPPRASLNSPTPTVFPLEADPPRAKL